METEIDVVMLARQADLPGGLQVHRALPQVRRRMVGPFVFVDQMGPVTSPPEAEFTVLPHPHIGLSTLTYLFEGKCQHRDSLGIVQPILPGEVNWMTAGRGVAHSERLVPGMQGRVFGVQVWVALPRALEECAPTFEHYDASAACSFADGGASVRLIAGSLFGVTSAVRTSSPLFYAEVRLTQGSVLTLLPEYEDRAAFVIEGSVELRETAVGAGAIAIFQRGREVRLEAREATHLMLLGGEPLDGERHIFWNFVSSSRERIRQAVEDWRHQRFDRVPGETRYIPLPEDGSKPVDYP